MNENFFNGVNEPSNAYPKLMTYNASNRIIANCPIDGLRISGDDASWLSSHSRRRGPVMRQMIQRSGNRPNSTIHVVLVNSASPSAKPAPSDRAQVGSLSQRQKR